MVARERERVNDDGVMRAGKQAMTDFMTGMRASWRGGVGCYNGFTRFFIFFSLFFYLTN